MTGKGLLYPLLGMTRLSRLKHRLSSVQLLCLTGSRTTHRGRRSARPNTDLSDEELSSHR